MYTTEQNERIDKFIDDYVNSHEWEMLPSLENIMYRFRYWFGKNSDLYEDALEALINSELRCSVAEYIGDEN